jgi:hypothetical protein
VCTSGMTTLPRGSSVRQKITGHLPPGTYYYKTK